LSFEDKILIKGLCEYKGFSVGRPIKESPNKNWKDKTSDEFLPKLRITGLIERISGSLCMCMLPMAVARFSSGVVAIRYLLPVLWMTCFFSIMGRIAV